MGRIFENMKSILSGLQIYDLSPKSYITHELTAYSAGFECVEKQLESIWREMFVMTAEGYGLDRWENIIFGSTNEMLDVSDRRKMILSALNVDGDWFTPKLMAGALGAAGIDAELEDVPSEERIVVKATEYRGQSLEYEAINKQLGTILSAHLDFTLDMGVFSWGIFDRLDFTFEEWDELDMTFSEIEENGHLLMADGI